MDKCKYNNISVAMGDNFSGRTKYLKESCENGGIYIGEIPSNYLSGIAPRVQDEINLFSTSSSPESKKAINDLLTKLNFNELFDRNPFLLSGGEQVMLTVVSALLCEPNVVAIDTALEQLSKEWKKLLFSLLNTQLENQGILLSDNRIREYGITYKEKLDILRKKNHSRSFNQPTFIQIKSEILPKRVSIKNLWFSYKKTKSNFKRN